MPTPSWGPRCSVTSPPAASRSSTRSRAQSCGQARVMESSARRSPGSANRLPGGPVWHHLGSDHDLLFGDRIDELLLLFERVAIVLPVAQDPELARRAAIGLEHDPREDLLALLQPEALDVEVRHPDSPAVVARVLAVVNRDALRQPLEQVADLGRLSHRSSPPAAPRSRSCIRPDPSRNK